MTRRESAAQPPEGTITFVFTDIEGSTRRVEELGDEAWETLQDAHHQIIRASFTVGHEVSTEGDAFFVAFAKAADALRAASSAQRAIRLHPWPDGRPLRVRIGIHTGEALVRDGNYVGHDVNRASRIRDAAHGGQILLSETTAALVRNALPAGVTLSDLGSHRLKDIGNPERLYTVESPDLASGFPPLLTLGAVACNLPVQRTAFIGRHAEIVRIRKLLEDHELVTLTGVGGAGKTRLALQVGAEAMDRHPDGVFFIDLAPVADPAVVARTAADAVGIPFEGELGASRPTEDLLVRTLARRKCLLILDNCEHLIDACAGLADRVLATCPDVQMLTTSREPLGLAGEQVCRVPSLSVPTHQADGGPSEAVELFIDRARSRDVDLDLTTDDVRTVTEICRRLDGIPLAIEFAAARVSHLSVPQIAARLDDRFRLLTGGRRRVPRQQTMATTLDWSYELLDSSEQMLLRRLAVFAGSFTLETAEDICAGRGLDRDDVLNLLTSLVDKSLVDTERADGQLRYRLLETVRSYTDAKLAEAGEADSCRSAHRDRYLAWLESIPWEELYFDGDVAACLDRELSNLRAALNWSSTQGRHDLVGRLATRGVNLWVSQGHSAEGRRWLEWALLDPASLDTALQADCHQTLAYTVRVAGGSGPEMEEHAARAVELGRNSLGARLVVPLGLLAQGAGIRVQATADPELARTARSLAQQAAEAGSEHGPPWTLLASLLRGRTMLLLDDVRAAERSFSAVLHEDPGSAATTFIRLGAARDLASCRILLGNAEGAVEATRWGIGAANQRTTPAGIIVASALAELQLGRAADAAGHLREALELTHPEAVPLTFNECLVFAGAMAHELGDAAMASRLLAAAVHVGAARETWVPFRTSATFLLYRHYHGLAQKALAPEEARRSRDEGSTMTPGDAFAAALELVEDLTA